MRYDVLSTVAVAALIVLAVLILGLQLTHTSPWRMEHSWFSSCTESTQRLQDGPIRRVEKADMLWMDENHKNLHHFGTTRNNYGLLVFMRESSFQGLLGGARFSSIHSSVRNQ